jgi:hypothetical protein
LSPGGPYELKIEGNGNVRRFFSAFPKEAAEDTPAIRRKAPRNVSAIFMMFSRVAAGALARENSQSGSSRPILPVHFLQARVELCFPSNPRVIFHSGIDPPNYV